MDLKYYYGVARGNFPHFQWWQYRRLQFGTLSFFVKVSEAVLILCIHFVQLTAIVLTVSRLLELCDLRLSSYASLFYCGPNWHVDESVKSLSSKFLFLFSSQEIQPSLEELALDTYGRKVLMYLLAPRSPAHFHPKVVELLKKGDGNSIRYRQSRECANLIG